MKRRKEALSRINRLVAISKKVRKESVRVNREFAAIEMSPEEARGFEGFDKRRS